MFQGGVKAHPRYMRWVRAATTLSPLLSLAPSPTSHSTHMTCARFGFHLVLFWIICHLSGQHNTACLPVRLSVCPRVCLFSFLFSVCLPGSWPVQLKAIITYVKKEARIMADMAWPDAIRCEAKRSDALLRDVLKTQWENCGNCGNTATTDQRLSNISLPLLSLLPLCLSFSWDLNQVGQLKNWNSYWPQS